MNPLAQVISAARMALGARVDSWVNQISGYGTARDKTMHSRFYGCEWLTDFELTSLFEQDDIAAKIVEAYPKEEMREGFGLTGFDADELRDVHDYLERYALPQTVTDSRIWARLFGGSVTWPVVDDGMDLIEPLDVDRIRSVLDLRVIDRRWIFPETYYSGGPQAGLPELYRMIQPQHGTGPFVTLGLIHESRLIVWPGERTEWIQKLRNRMWDNSVLLRPYAALRSAGNTWKSIELLVQDANQGVFKIGRLWEKVASDPTQGEDFSGGVGVASQGPSGLFLKRIQIMDQLRSALRSIVLDKDDEDFTRVTTAFSGLSELSQQAWIRVAAAADMPVTILTGQAPAGLNATGDSDLRWFNSRTAANQRQIVQPRLLRLIKIMLAAQDAPPLPPADGRKDPFEQLKIMWLPLWAPTAAELADIRLKRSQEAQIWIENQAITPGEAILSLPEDWWTFDRERAEADSEIAPEPAPTDQQPGAPGGKKANDPNQNTAEQPPAKPDENQ